jgi:hypothetical protein
MPVAQGHESAEQLFWEGQRILDVDETVIRSWLVAVEAKLLPKILCKWTIEDNVLTGFLCLVDNFTHRAVHIGFVTKIHTTVYLSHA